jgi:twitching motility protein PilT
VSRLFGVRLADIVNIALLEKASDIHLVPDCRPRIRAGGVLHELPGSVLSAADVDAIAAALFEQKQVEQIRVGNDVNVAVVDDTTRVTLRVHGQKTYSGTALAIRLLGRAVPTIDELRLPEVVGTFAALESGLVILCGATGSGKSSSLAALIDEMNRSQPRRIVILEDPVEYRHESHRSLITQRELGRDARSFPEAIRGSLRADPDVIVIGEVRDGETIRAALTAAETGHLVLTTMHCGNAVQAIDRVLDGALDANKTYVRGQLAAALTAIVCQRLVPNEVGSGRRPLVEVLIANDGVRAMIRDGRNHLIGNAMVTGRRAGMQTFEQHRSELASGGSEADRVGEHRGV